MSTVKKKLSESSTRPYPKSAEDDGIDYSDIPELDDGFWEKAEIFQPKQPKKQITMRISADVLEWFKAQGKGYQTRMDAVLRHYYEQHKHD